MEFEIPSGRARFAQLGYLFKHTFTIFGRNMSIVRPIVKMSVYACFMLCLFAWGGVSLLYGSAGLGSLLIFMGVVLYIYRFFYYNRVGLVLSRMVYTSATGGDPKAHKARHYLSGLHTQVFLLGVLDMVVFRARKSSSNEGFFMKMLLGGLAGLGGLVSHFLVPAVAVDKLGVRESVGKLSALKDNIPESLSGVFGISIMGRIVGTIMGWLYLVALVLGLIMGVLLGAHLPAAFSMGEIGNYIPVQNNWPLIGPHTVFNWLPLCCVIFLTLLANAVFARIVDAIKVVYYTLFYTRINHAGELAPDIRKDLEGYLRLEEQPSGEGTSIVTDV